MNLNLQYAWASIRSQPLLHLVVVMTMAVLLALPLTVYQLVQRYEAGLRNRALSTPLVLTVRGNRFDQVFSSLFYEAHDGRSLSWRDLEELREHSVGRTVPLLFGPMARPVDRDAEPSALVIGTDVEIFYARELEIARGGYVQNIGEFVAGAEIAARWGLNPGDVVETEPHVRFDVSRSGQFLLKCAGILQPTGEAEDHVLFTTMETSWVLEDLGHFHEGPADQDHTRSPAEVIRDLRTDAVGVHFHGSRASYPITSVLLTPDGSESAAVAKAHYLHHPRLSLLEPAEIVEVMMQRILKIRDLYTRNQLWVTTVSFLLLAGVFHLVLQARKPERYSLFQLGVPAGRWWRMVLAEWLLLLGIGVLLGMMLTWINLQMFSATLRLV